MAFIAQKAALESWMKMWENIFYDVVKWTMLESSVKKHNGNNCDKLSFNVLSQTLLTCTMQKVDY